MKNIKIRLRKLDDPISRTFFRVYSNSKFVLTQIQSRRIVKYLRDYSANEASGEPVVFHLGTGFNAYLLYFESYLATKLLDSGVPSKILINDIHGQYYDGFSANDRSIRADFRFREKVLARLFRIFDSDLYLPYSRLITDAELASVKEKAGRILDEDCMSFDGIDIRQYVNASVVRYFKSAPTLVPTEPEYSAVRRAFVENAVLGCVIAERVDESLSPRLVVSSHGVYTTWGPFYRYFADRNRPFVLYGLSGVKESSISLSSQGVTLCEHDGGFFRKYHSQMDAGWAEDHAREIMDGRFTGKGRDLDSHEVALSAAMVTERLRQRIGAAPSVAMFPGVLWEGRGPESHQLFETRDEWLLRTVEIFETRKERLVIRAHPAEVNALRCRFGVRDVLEKAFGKEIFESDDLIFIPPDAKVRSYDLFDLIDAGITYDGTIALELMYAEIPVVLGGQSQYSELPFAYRPESFGAYETSFDRLDEILEKQQKNRDLFYKYIPYYFDLRFVPTKLVHHIRTAFREVNDPRQVLQEPALKSICQTMLGHREYFQTIGLNPEWRSTRSSAINK